MSVLFPGLAAALFIGALHLAIGPALAGGQGEARPEISGDPERPRRHFRIRDAAYLDKSEALDIYRGLKKLMVAGYKRAGDPVASAYLDWQIYNNAPYRSATHGQRYVNNFANRLARDYGRFEEAGAFPVGAVIAKDSIAITAAGEVYPGPLFVMEKMPEGFSNAGGDWRYTMIMPDGSLLGVTKGEGAQRVEFCIGCHLAREDYDHLYFPPKEFRVVP